MTDNGYHRTMKSTKTYVDRGFKPNMLDGS